MILSWNIVIVYETEEDYKEKNVLDFEKMSYETELVMEPVLKYFSKLLGTTSYIVWEHLWRHLYQDIDFVTYNSFYFKARARVQ